eukprot:TRINITY_DN2993_c0_g1_i1.p1 TRINITY_DN2993_c0_g1~~TRINITY_DN2993_c0_g1_i1.p1  ORF type:complete len:499 (-),score=134.61 TRINITY_DN2993_c0_g1_i1:80-1576(-)
MVDYEEVGGHHHGFGSFYRRHKVVVWLIVLLVVVVIVITGTFVGIQLNKKKGEGETPLLRDYVTAATVMNGLNDLWKIAQENNGTRAAGTTGYEASVNYILGQLKQTDYEVSVQLFNFSSLIVVEPPTLEQVNPVPKTWTYQTDYNVMGSGEGPRSANAEMFIVSSLGCNEEDWDGFPPGYIALVTRGVCAFQDKANLAANHSASAVLIYNDGADPSRTGLINAGVSSPGLPVFFATYAVGLYLTYSPGPIVLSLSVNNKGGTTITKNVIAHTRAGKNDTAVVIGSHLDSVPAGAGINDNGSGSALNLALALELFKTGLSKSVANQVRFCWFGAEELGLLGSEAYVESLIKAGTIGDIAANLNFDMIGSTNFFRGIYNGTSAAQGPAHNGSATIQYLFLESFNKRELATQPTPFDGRSDYGPFLAQNIPAGGLFTGAEGIKSPAELLLYGGIMNAPYDSCYHQSCDTILNINQVVAGEMAYAAAEVVQNLVFQPDIKA